MPLPQFPGTIYLVRNPSGDFRWEVGINAVENGIAVARYNLDTIYTKVVTTQHSLTPVKD